jgi:hypothetical protein
LKLLLLNGTKSQISNEDWNAIHKIRGAFENSLRSEIGIFYSKPVGKMEDLDKIYSYIDEKRKKLKNL